MYRVIVSIVLAIGGGCRFTPVALPSARADGAKDHRAVDVAAGVGDAAPTIVDGVPGGDAFTPTDGPARSDTPNPLDFPRPLDAAPAIDRAVDANPGRWYQVNQAFCPSFCVGEGRVNSPSPEGANCMSGEVRPQSGIDQGIVFSEGCWPNCNGQAGPLPAFSVDGYCYLATQKQDNDGTDETIGCFCR